MWPTHNDSKIEYEIYILKIKKILRFWASSSWYFKKTLSFNKGIEGKIAQMVLLKALI